MEDRRGMRPVRTGVGLSIGGVLFLLVLSGVIMGLQVKALRKLTITWSVVGSAAFVGFVLLG